MNKKLYIVLLMASFYSSSILADALIFRGSQAQKDYENRMNETNAIKRPTWINNDPLPVGNYDLQGINGVESKLAINEDGSFSWYMNYKKTNLETHGYWTYENSNNDSIVLTTNPMPGDIQFKYKDSNNTGNNLAKYMAMGNIDIYVGYEPKRNLDKNGPLKGVKVTCSGVYGKVTVITDENGKATCNRAGVPLNFITFEAPNIPNKTTFNKPKFNDFSWNFTFDYEHAHTGYAFYKERMVYSEGKLTWDAASLGGQQQWIYFK